MEGERRQLVPPETHPGQAGSGGEDVVYDLTDNGNSAAPTVTVPANGHLNGQAHGQAPDAASPGVAVPTRSLRSRSRRSPKRSPKRSHRAARVVACSNLTHDDAAAADAAPVWEPPEVQEIVEAPADVTASGWGAPTELPDVVPVADEPVLATGWGVDDAVVVDTSATTPPSVDPAGEDPNAPLPGWRKGGDGNWDPPGQELPAARSELFPTTPRSSTAAKETAATSSVLRRRLPLIAAAVVVVALLAVGGFLFFSGGDEPEPAAESAATDDGVDGADHDRGTRLLDHDGDGGAGGAARSGQWHRVQPWSPSAGPSASRTWHSSPTTGVGLLLDGAAGRQRRGRAGAHGRHGRMGAYLGVLPVNFVVDQPFSAVRVEADGPWAVTFAVVESAPVVSVSTGQRLRGPG